MVKEKYNVYYRALKELSEIIKFFSRNEYRKIPKTFINFEEKRIREKYNPDDIFKKRNIQQKKDVITNKVAMIQ